MKKGKRVLLSFLMILAMGLMVCGFRPVQAQAATKKVKKIQYTSELTSKIKKNATVVKKGTTTLKVTKEGFLKFRVPATKTYTFTFSKQTEPNGNYNNGYAYIKRVRTNSYSGKQYLDSLKFKTQGGKTTSAYFNANASSTPSTITTGTFIPKRSCKVKLKKGETVYLYLYFAHKGSIRLNIK